MSADFMLRQVRDHVESGGPSSKYPYVEQGDSSADFVFDNNDK